MKELERLLRYSRPYVPHLPASVVLMAVVGAAQALTVLPIVPVFDRVLSSGGIGAIETAEVMAALEALQVGA